MVLVIIFSVQLNWLPAVGAGPGGSGEWKWDWEHFSYLVLPAITTSVIPMGIVTRTVRALTGDILSQDFVEALRAKGLREWHVFRHVIKNAAPTALAVMGLQLGYMLGGSILIETVFSWPGSGLLLNSAIFQRDLPLLQGTILVLALFFVFLNLMVDIAQAVDRPAHQARLTRMDRDHERHRRHRAAGRARHQGARLLGDRRPPHRPRQGQHRLRDHPDRDLSVGAAGALARPRRSLSGIDDPPTPARSARRTIRSAPTSSAATCSRA